ncbi:L,D-transpeptidase [Ramlibacter monticola]|uniref:L,D-transpeptidase n=1 Tax=Ramlibacter monticola TaxID=1926872 RepID=A0A936Z179_9BURK|nr:L,D-transpeptidase [Ramlibacter monticola]
MADFGDADAPADVVRVANWVSATRNQGKRAFVLIDKKNARLYVFDPRGKLKDHTPVLLGKAVGDDSAPGIGSKPLSQIKEEEKTTPAGRFLAAPGKNNHGEDIIWIDYKAAVSMHRLRRVSAEERRAERMATPESDDNRISNGCVNVPPDFYNSVLRPSVRKYGAYVYVLPETRTPEQLFGSLAVPSNQSKA